MNPNLPVTEADLHAYVDGQLALEREREIEAYLASRPNEALRCESYRTQKLGLRALFDPVLDEAPSRRVLRSARPPVPWYLQRLAAGVAIALVSGATGWGLHGDLQSRSGAGSLALRDPAVVNVASAAGFAQRAAVAHAVYSPDQRRPVEVDAAHEDQLVAWLSKRMEAPMHPPKLLGLGYALEGGRLLPGAQGPVAQFMYRRAEGGGAEGKLTLYVSKEIGDPGVPQGGAGGKNAGTAFSFAQQGKLNVFYWVDGPFGYAISAEAERSTLALVSGEVYRQLDAARK